MRCSREEEGKEGLRVLAIGGDIGVWEGASHPTRRRQREYARRCDRFIYLCHTPPRYRPLHFGTNHHIYPTNSVFKWLFPLDVLTVGLRLCKRWSPQVIVSQDAFVFGFPALLLKTVTGLPLVVHFHSSFFYNSHWLGERKYRPFVAKAGLWLSKRAEYIRAVSSDIQRKLVGKGLSPERVIYATPPVDPGSFLEVDRRGELALMREFNLTPGRTFVFVGRLSKEKNISLILRAVRRLSGRYEGLRLFIIGAGPEEKRLKLITSRLGISEHVIFLGYVPQREIRNYFRVSCALLVSSHFEGTAKVLKEAALAETPAISTATSGTSDAIRGGETGLVLVRPDDAQFAEAMESLLRDPEEASLMGKRGRKYVLENFDYQRDVERIVQIWKKAALVTTQVDS